MLLWMLCACPAVQEPLPVRYHRQMEQQAIRLAPDPLRGGPPPLRDAAPLPPFSGVDRGTDRYIGSTACAACHPAAAAVWSASSHARAMAALEQAGASRDPACFRCHTTGAGHPGGYRSSAQDDLRAVGCESCHGPGSGHLERRQQGAAGEAAPDDYGSLPRDGASCVGCHSHDTSPDFRFADRWPEIRHR